ncbi:MAG: hypothetical protein MUO26_04655 [Methanotrichaceae archaeon]|nr:hypothetical protein [Methanotrichaceae archaeon]
MAVKFSPKSKHFHLPKYPSPLNEFLRPKIISGVLVVENSLEVCGEGGVGFIFGKAGGRYWLGSRNKFDGLILSPISIVGGLFPSPVLPPITTMSFPLMDSSA